MSFRTLHWAFALTVVLHNCEEAIFMPAWVVIHRDQLPFQPGAGIIRAGLMLATLAALVVTVQSARRGPQSFWSYLWFGGAAAMCINVFVPHVPATFIFRQYTPGVVTAVLLNLPLMSVILYKAVREHWVSGARAVWYAVLVPVASAGLIAALFALS